MISHERSAEAAPGFDALLGDVDRRGLDATPDVVVGVWPDLTIAYVNDAWWRFARDNGARWEGDRWGLGADLLAPIPPVLREYYAGALRGVLRTGQPWEHDYECSAPDTYRTFRLRVLPLARAGGLLLTHTLRIERPHPPPEGFPGDAYVDENRQIVQCAHCRRVRRTQKPRRWDWVPSYVSTPPADVSHSICDVCASYYFGPYAARLSLQSGA